MACQQRVGFRKGLDYLAGADFIKRYECERLSKHSTCEVFFGECNGDGKDREPELRQEGQ